MSALAFTLPDRLEAHAPPEALGLPRDGVRLLVARSAAVPRLEHRVFRDLPDLLAPGDLVVVNRSLTLPAALDGIRGDGTAVRVHVAGRAPALPGEWRIVELRTPSGSRPLSASPPEELELPDGAWLELTAPYMGGERLTLARFHGTTSVERLLHGHGRPIRYGYVEREWPLAAYHNVYADAPGSAEMPSAGRPFTDSLLERLAERGIGRACITLHCGLSSPERHELPAPEPYEVPPATAEAVNATRAAGGRVVAVGTTVVRALESARTEGGTVEPRREWTNHVVDSAHPPRVIDGLITGWHEPEASHLLMLEALAGPELIADSYDAALGHGYLWHEFGDSHLILIR